MQFEPLSTAKTSAKPFLVRPGVDKLRVHSEGRFVIKDPESGIFMSTAEAILPARDFERNGSRTQGDMTPFIAVTDENDISGRLGNALTPIFTLQTGPAWPNGEMTTLYCFDEGIIEYRSTAGVPSSKIGVTGVPANYLVTYASVGIPAQRYAWIQDYLGELGLQVVRGERDVENRDYVFVNANITKGYSVPFIIRTKSGVSYNAGENDHHLLNAMRKIGQNVIGVIGLEINLKRSRDFSDYNRTYVISPSLKMVQMCDLTSISTPPISRAISFAPSERVTSARLLDALTAHEDEDISSTSDVKPLGGRKAAIPGLK